MRGQENLYRISSLLRANDQFEQSYDHQESL